MLPLMFFFFFDIISYLQIMDFGYIIHGLDDV